MRKLSAHYNPNTTSRSSHELLQAAMASDELDSIFDSEDEEHVDLASTGNEGHLYGLAAGENYAATKLGRTRAKDPYEALKKRYQTSLVPLNIISIVPVVNSVVAEAWMREFFAKRRLEINHEVFDMTAADGGFDHEAWQRLLETLQMLNENSGGPLPEPVEFVRARREAQQAARRRELELEREANKKEREEQRLAAKAAEQAERKRKREEERAEKQRIDAEKQAEARAIKHAQTSEAISSFIREHCKYGADYTVSIAQFKEAYARLTMDSMTGEAMRKYLDQKGIVIVQRKGLKTIKGLCLKP